MLLNLLRDPRTIIRHLQNHLVSLFPASHRNGSLCGGMGHGIADEVHEQLHHEPAVKETGAVRVDVDRHGMVSLSGARVLQGLGPMSRKRTLILESRQILPILRKISSASSLDSGAHYPLDPFLLPSSKESISDSSWLKAHQSTRG